MSNPRRVSAGVPSGGQFAASERAETGLSLAAEAIVIASDEDTGSVDYEADSDHVAVPEENIGGLGSPAETDWAAKTVRVDVLDGPVQEWATVDSDDRYHGQFTSHVGERDGFRLRIDPGDYSTYDAPGFQWSATDPNGIWNFSGLAATRDDAAREAATSADYVTSGRAEHDYYTDEYAGETG